MSLNLLWEPTQPEDGRSLPDALKYILRERWGNGNSIERRTLTFADVPYLQGLADAKVKGAQELIDAIEQHERVDIWTA